MKRFILASLCFTAVYSYASPFNISNSFLNQISRHNVNIQGLIQYDNELYKAVSAGDLITVQKIVQPHYFGNPEILSNFIILALKLHQQFEYINPVYTVRFRDYPYFCIYIHLMDHLIAQER